MVNYTPSKNIPYPNTSDSTAIASRDFRDLAWGVDAALVSTESYLNGRVDTTQNQITNTAAQIRTELAVQGEEFEQLLDGVSTAYDVAVANGYSGTISQWLTSLRGPQGPEGPAGGTSVTDPQVASYIGASTATQAALESAFIARRGTRGFTRTIYVRATGNDTNDGKTETSAFREIRAAVDTLSNDGPVIRGSVVIDVGPGTYKGGIILPQTRGRAQDDFIKIVGPSVGGSPNVPTVIVDHALDPQTYGIFGMSATFWVENIKFVGPFAQAVDAREDSYLQYRNVHIDGANIGLNLVSHSRYYVVGGIIENCDTGVSELFGIVRNYAGAGSNVAQLTVRNCVTGVNVKENCVGHFDHLNIDDCQVGLELNLFSGANVRLMRLRRNGVGIVLANGEIHAENSVQWGTGADANTRRILSFGSSSELVHAGWSDGMGAERTGHRPMIVLSHDYTDKVITGTTTETIVYAWASRLRADMYAVKGKHARIVVYGTSGSSVLAAPYRVLLRISGLAAELALPAGFGAGQHFKMEFDMIAAADGASQKFVATLTAQGASYAYVAARSFDMSTVDRGVNVSAVPGNVADSVTFRVGELYG